MEVDLDQYCEAYDMLEIPTGSDGKHVTVDNLTRALEHLGYDLTEIDMDKFLAKVVDHPKPYDFFEFCRLIADVDWEADMRLSFRLFDRNGVGYLTLEDLDFRSEDYTGINPIAAVIDLLKVMAQTNYDGRVYYDEFMATATK